MREISSQTIMSKILPRGAERDTPELARAYAERSLWQRVRGLLLIDLARPQSAESVLDLGCGTGELTLELARRVRHDGRVIGIDPDQSRLDLARDRRPPTWGQVDFRQATAEDMGSVPTGSIDLLFSNYVIHWVRDLPAMLREAERVLKPGGRLIAEFAGTPLSIFDDLLALMPEADALLAENTFLEDGEWRRIIGTRKFRILALDWLELSLRYESLSELLAWVEATSHGAFRPWLLSATDRSFLEAQYRGEFTVPLKGLRMNLRRI